MNTDSPYVPSSHEYDDIIDLPHFEPDHHPRMSMTSRAAQFSPFAALTGYEDVIDETARLTDRRIPLEDEQKLEIDSKLDFLKEHLRERPEVTLQIFLPDDKKDGGRYIDVTGYLRRIEEVEMLLVFTDGRRYSVRDVYSVDSPILPDMFRD